jgi:hypothetical protein
MNLTVLLSSSADPQISDIEADVLDELDGPLELIC